MFHTKVVEKIKTHVSCSVIFFFENLAVYEIMWKNIVQPDRPKMTIGSMRIVCWITKATNTHSEYVILTAFPGKNGYTNAPLFQVIHLLLFEVFKIKTNRCYKQFCHKEQISLPLKGQSCHISRHEGVDGE